MNAKDLCNRPSRLSLARETPSPGTTPGPQQRGQRVGGRIGGKRNATATLCPELTRFRACRGIDRRDRSKVTEKRLRMFFSFFVSCTLVVFNDSTANQKSRLLEKSILGLLVE